MKTPQWLLCSLVGLWGATSLMGCSHGRAIRRLTSEDMPNRTVLNSWVELGPDSSMTVRSVVKESSCPALIVNANPIPMRPRPNLDADAFPVTVCEAVLPQSSATLEIQGKLLPSVPVDPQKILILGDTGCRIKGEAGHLKIQACKDEAAWPLATISASAAAWKPELVIHVGDYHYREAECPSGDARCEGSIAGDRWASWQQDFFDPVSPLLSASPWIFVRGNHENCSRGGNGWFQLLDPRSAPQACLEQTPPYQVSLGELKLSVIDSADEKNIQPSLETLKSSWRAQSWLLLHRPFLTPGADDESDVESHLPQELRGAGLLGMVLVGHQHLFSLNRFADFRPPEIVTGNGATLLEKPAGVGMSLTDLERPGVSAKIYGDFGFMTLQKRPDHRWIMQEHDRFGKVVLECQVDSSFGQKTKITCADAS